VYEGQVEGLLKRGRDVSDTVQGVTVQEQVSAGTELALGISTETDFGPVVMVGRGGTDLESIDDITFRSIPVVEEQARAMLEELATIDHASLSETVVESIVDAITGISSLYLDNLWIKEADINPLIVRETDVCAVDALFIPQ
jgi:acyl-CoA synthetase (NDP forming)